MEFPINSRISIVTYAVSQSNASVAYAWTIPQGWKGNLVGPIISVTANNTGGTISVQGTNLCGTGPFSTYNINVDSILPHPAVIDGKIKVFTNEWNYYLIPKIAGAYGYSWSATGNAIIQPDGNSTAVKWTSSGNFELTVNANNRCGSSASKIVITVIDFPFNPDHALRLWPNPTPGFFFINAKDLFGEKINIEIKNMMGQAVYREQDFIGNNNFSHFINLDKMQPGQYVVEVITTKKSYREKILIIR